MMLPYNMDSLYLDREELKGIVQGYADDDSSYLSVMIPAINGDMPLAQQGTNYGGYFWAISADAFFAQAGKMGPILFGQDYPELAAGKLSHNSFFTKKYAKSVVVPKEALQIPPADRLNSIGQYLLQLRSVVRGEAEKTFADFFSNTSVFTQTHACTNDWTTATGDPVADINTAIDAVATLADPDTIILGRKAYTALLANAKWNDARPLTDDRATMLEGLSEDPLRLLKESIAKRFGLKHCFFSTARWNSSATKATTTVSNQMADICWVGRMGDFGPADSIMQQGGAYQISPRAFIKSQAGDLEFEQEEHLGRVELGAAWHVGIDVVDAKLGYVITNCA